MPAWIEPDDAFAEPVETVTSRLQAIWKHIEITEKCLETSLSNIRGARPQEVNAAKREDNTLLGALAALERRVRSIAHRGEELSDLLRLQG